MPSTANGTPRPLEVESSTELESLPRPVRRSKSAPSRQGEELVVEMTGAARSNLLYRAYRSLLAIGVQIVEARHRLAGDLAIQTLRLAELDDGALAPVRVSEVFNTLRIACAQPTLVESDASRRVGSLR